MKISNSSVGRSLMLVAAFVSLVSVARATENGASVWPVGAETYATAAGVPAPGQTLIFNYTCYSDSNALVDGKGDKLATNFKLHVGAVAFEIAHNWGKKLFGGYMESHMAAPFVYEHVTSGTTTNSTENFSNINMIPLDLLYHKGSYYWVYSVEFQTAAPGYQKGAMNIGQHNTSLTPSFAVTAMPHKGAQQYNAVAYYIVNNVDHATHYHSGNEFLSQFAFQQALPHRTSLGVQGSYYQQTTNDTQNGAIFSSTNVDGTTSVGNKGRVLNLGPQYSLPWGKSGLIILKYQHDMLVENKARTNSLWFEFGIPFSYLHHVHAEKE